MLGKAGASSEGSTGEGATSVLCGCGQDSSSCRMLNEGFQFPAVCGGEAALSS